MVINMLKKLSENFKKELASIKNDIEPWLVPLSSYSIGPHTEGPWVQLLVKGIYLGSRFNPQSQLGHVQ